MRQEFNGIYLAMSLSMSFKREFFIILILILVKTPSYSANSCMKLFSETKVTTYQKNLKDIAGGKLNYIKFGVGLKKINSLDDFAIARYGEKMGPEALQTLRSQNVEALIIDAGIVLHYGSCIQEEVRNEFARCKSATSTRD